MSILHKLPHSTEKFDASAHCVDHFLAAEHELAAFTTAVRKTAGEDAAGRAAEYWLAELDQISTAKLSSGSRRPEWRRISILAASRLAQENSAGKIHCMSSRRNHSGGENRSSNSSMTARIRNGFDSFITYVEAFIVYMTKDLILLLLSM
jgi:hypothetical protein